MLQICNKLLIVLCCLFCVFYNAFGLEPKGIARNKVVGDPFPFSFESHFDPMAVKVTVYNLINGILANWRGEGYNREKI